MERGICARISDHQRQRGRPVDRRLHRVLRRRARAQGHHHLCRGDLRQLAKFKAACRHGARRRQVDRRDQARPVGRPAAAPRWRIPARSPAASRRSTRSRARSASSAPIRSTTRSRSPNCSCIPARRTGRRLGAVTLSGAFRGLLLDAAERNGLEFPPARIRRRPSGSMPCSRSARWSSNPIDGGFGVLSSADNFMASIDALQATRTSTWCWCRRDRRARPAPTAPSITSGSPTTTPPPRPRSRSHSCTPIYARPDRLQPRAAAPRRRTSRSCRRPTRRCARSPASRAATSASASHAIRLWQPQAPAPECSAPSSSACAAARDGRSRSRSTKRESKDVLRAYGIATPDETLVTSPAAAIEGRRSHRLSGRAQGGVADAAAQVRRRRGRAQPRDARSNWQPPTTRWRSGCSDHSLTGMLVCQQIRGGLELVLGLHRDPRWAWWSWPAAAACCSN